MPAATELNNDPSRFSAPPVAPSVGSGGSVLDDDYIPDFLRRGF
jgi:hypothetical protein